MAQRRMFSLKIVDSDAFMDMSQTAQLLYFHLAMRADDDGFVGNPKRIMRMVGTNDDDIKILLAKRFLLGFESGVVVIKHWRVHNLIRKDIYTETDYKLEKATLGLNESEAYTEMRNGVRTIRKLEKNEKPLWLTERQKARKESTLPDSFDYKIRLAFVGKTCPICKIEMREKRIEDIEYGDSPNPWPSVQHNIPISKGGKHELENISVICQSCNVSNGNIETGELNSKEVIEEWNRINTVGTQSATQDREVKDSKGKNTPSATASDDVEYSETFMSFWSAYPKKTGKGAAYKSWQKLKPSKALTDKIVASVVEHSKTKQWQKENGQFIPNPATFLNQRRWEDEINEGTSASSRDLKYNSVNVRSA